MLNKKALAGTASAPKEYVEDVFSTYLYTGNSSTQTINNGIDLAGEGGLVWIKSRSNVSSNTLYDTVRGNTKSLYSNTTNAESTATAGTDLSGFNSNGFSLGEDYLYTVNYTGYTYASWTFRKAPKFFDVVTYTGTGSARTVAHDLGTTPGMVIVKCTSFADQGWRVWHRSFSSNDNFLALNNTNAVASASTIWNSTAPTSTVFSVGTSDSVNKSGETYVAYLFAHDAGGFGDAGTDNIISCGSFTGASTVTLGYEPQWIIVKRTGSSDDWYIVDTMRNWSVVNYTVLRPNTSAAEQLVDAPYIVPTATGFTTTSTLSGEWIYMAIRRPMKTPTSGTEVFVADAAGANASANGEVFSSTFPVDWHFRKERSSSGNNWFSNSRLVPGNSLTLNTTNAESTLAFVDKYDRMSGIATTTGFNYTDWAGWLFKRARGFFDIVCYTGTGSATTVTHNLGVAPELMIVKGRNVTGEAWTVYAAPVGNTKYLRLDGTSEAVTSSTRWNDTTPTSTVFTLGTDTGVNWNTYNYVAYLFATVAGVSKVGSYTGNGSARTIDCGFTTGARFVLIKRTNSTGDWYVWDTARGIVSGNDPYLLLNSTAAEEVNSDFIGPASSGFAITSSAPAGINANNDSYIFFAIA